MARLKLVALGLRDEVFDVDQELLHEVVQAPPAFPDGNVVGEPVTSLGGGHCDDDIAILSDPVADLSALLEIDELPPVHEPAIELASDEMEDSDTAIDELTVLVGCIADATVLEEPMLLIELDTGVIVCSEDVSDDRVSITI
ncbi:hypothetical protein K7432_014850 [Basidiobolus ranarum]|uniref:Uncharacterized protein n=1 Tax=Basidiobolus ranarum TaxID=34480 RepID=A0ABR2VP18_9FUNG